MDINRMEALQAKKDGGVPVKNSGRGLRKGDARRGRALIDYKFTDRGSYSVNLKAMQKFEVQAWREGMEPIVVTIFTDDNDRGYATLSWDTLKELLDKEAKLDGITN